MHRHFLVLPGAAVPLGPQGLPLSRQEGPETEDGVSQCILPLPLRHSLALSRGQPRESSRGSQEHLLQGPSLQDRRLPGPQIKENGVEDDPPRGMHPG